MSLWKGRVSGKMSNVMEKLNNSLSIDIELLPYDAKLNEVWAEELNTLGIISNDELSGVKKTLATLKEDFDTGKFETLPDDEDVHTLVERTLTEALGETGKKIHTGKSRNDQVVTDFMLYLKDATSLINVELNGLVKALVQKAEENIDIIMPGYTHLQQAQPILLSHYLLSLAYSLYEDKIRLNNFAKTSLGKCPLGSGALAGTTLNIDRMRVASKLGFETPTANSLQTVSDRAFVIEFLSVLSIISMHLSRYAEDFIIWSSKEFNFLKLANNVTTGSSMMPQKRNPDSMELIRGLTGTLYGNLVGIMTITKGLPLSYAKDLQDDKKLTFGSVEAILNTLSLFSESIKGAEFNSEAMKNSIMDEVLATDLADVCIDKGLSFRDAHEAIGKAVTSSLDENISLKEALSKELPKITFSEADFAAEASIEKRSTLGGTSKESVEKQIKDLIDLL